MIPNVFEIWLAKRAQAEEFFKGQIFKFLCSETCSAGSNRAPA